MTPLRIWTRLAWVYGLLLAFGVFFVGPFVMGFLASLKANPLEWPFTLRFAQVNPKNWMAAWQLGWEGAGNPWLGGMAPGRSLVFDVAYFSPGGQEPEVLAVIPRRRPGAGMGAVFETPYAADYVRLEGPELVEVRAATLGDQEGTVFRYRLRLVYSGEGPFLERVPLDLETPRGVVLVGATLDPTRLERRGRVASWDNVAPGLLGYVFHNYVRAFRETRSLETGESLFLRWTLNSFLLASVKVLTTLVFASMAGYALARLRFPGKQALFLFMLFSMMVPAQVTFISNYLVLRDGIFGLSKLFGVDTLLNTYTGLVLSGLVGAGAVFIMRQFFESIPREVEEAALIDGATPVQILFRIVLPMSTPALGALAILTFQGAWNEFFWPFVVLTSPRDIYTLPLGLLSFRNAYGQVGDWGLILAGGFFSMIPVLVLFMFFQRYFVEGPSLGALRE
ncbi:MULTISPECIES: carbohydrate ABC transporter permease [Thermus]|uniref:Carbohydrate ABC transporter permease n=2 Tax=Thermus scotoductus TaxID=37636 RepID=A0A430R6P1_THESC|nr:MULTISPECIES: carbohydrate ABC transporter permease [Thermus]ADW21824.1 binding-protein-dependent transport systems inner membrane component [Thermus scotoductus SA-01]RTH02971.1 carbohydrate ABC transporter permease [Thermus scotoductus]